MSKKACQNCKNRTHNHAHWPFVVAGIATLTVFGILYELFAFSHAQVRKTAELYGRITHLETQIEYLEGDRDYIYNELYSLSLSGGGSTTTSTDAHDEDEIVVE